MSWGTVSNPARRKSAVVVLAWMMTMPTGLLALAGNAAAHADTPLIDHGLAADDGFWNVVEGFSTRTGFRLTFIWDADEAVAGIVHWGFDEDALDRVARPLADAADMAGVAMIDIPRSDVTPGREVFFRVTDQLTGDVSPLRSFPLGNGRTSDVTDTHYEIDLVVQLDTEALPEDVPADQSLIEIAEGMDVFAERVWDFTDGYIRIGNVLVTDTQLNYPVYRPRPDVVFFPALELCPPSTTVDGMTVQHTMADMLFTTTVPFDSHVISPANRPAIDSECHAMYLGREGQLVTPWRDEMHVGAVTSHEFAHYALNLEDLYPLEGFTDANCITGVTGVPDNAAGRYDISVMHNTFGWTGSRWKGSEIDRVATPCNRDNRGPQWDIFVSEYPAVPLLGRNGDGFPDHSDSVYNQAKDNPDGGILDIYILDNAVGASSITQFISSEEVTPPGDAEVDIDSPAEGASLPAASVQVSGTVDRDADANEAPTATLSATPSDGAAPLAVTFTLGASDADGTIASWSLAYGDGSVADSGTGAPPASASHTYSVDGAWTATLSVVDDAGAPASATAVVNVGGIPQSDGSLIGNVFMFNEGGLGLSNVLAIATGEVLSDDTPRYVAGEPATSISLRSSYSEVFTYDCSDPVAITLWDADTRQRVAGPLSASCNTEDAIGSADCPQTCYIRSATFPIPPTFEGEYYIVATATDTVTGAHHAEPKKILVLGAPAPNSPGPSDAGHDIADVDNDGTAPITEILWADVDVTATDLNAVLQLGGVTPPSGYAAHGYSLIVNGVNIQSLILVEAGLWDATNGAIPPGSTTWDTATNRVTFTIPRSYLASIDADCPCQVSTKSSIDPLGVGGIVDVDFAPDAGTVQAALPVLTLSASDPEASDPAGDAGATNLPWMDVRKVWISGETPTTFSITLKVEDMASLPPSADVGAAKLATNYGVEFCTDNNVNHADLENGWFCYRLSAVNGLPTPSFSGGIIQRDGTGSCGLGDLVSGGVFDLAADTVTWTVVRAKFDITVNSASVQTCPTAAAPNTITRGGAGIVDGTTLNALEAATGHSAGAVLIATSSTFGDTTDPTSARPYTFGGMPLSAEAGGPYSGIVGNAIAISGTASGGAEPATCAWSGSGATFADAGACATTVTYASEGAFTVTLTVTDAASATATDTATVNVGGTTGERVELYLDGTLAGSVEVATGPTSPEAAWTLPVDLTGLVGPHTLTARWVDATDEELDVDTVNVFVQESTGGAFVTIENPADDPDGSSPLSGTIAVDGTAGHELDEGLALTVPFAATTVSGSIAVFCVGCQDVGLSTSVTWGQSATSGDFAGLDGVYLPVSGYGGGSYVLEGEFGSVMDVYFYVDPVDVDELGSNVGIGAVKSGTVPDGANWAFVYMRRPTPQQLTEEKGFAENAQLTLSTSVVAPSAPRGLVATQGDGSVTLAWQVPLDSGGEPVSVYTIYRDGASFDSVTGAVLTWMDAGLPGEAHTYHVTASNSAGEGPASNSVTEAFGDPVDKQPPGDINDLAATILGDHEIQLSWTPAEDDQGGVVSYEIRRNGVLRETTTEVTLTDSGLASATTYTYGVRAVDVAGNRGLEATVSATTTGDPSAEEVRVYVDGTLHDVLPVDTTAGTASWGTSLDTTTLSSGPHTIRADYTDGAGGSASATARINVQNEGLGVDITQPSDGATVGTSFTVAGTTAGTGGPAAPMSNSFLGADRTVDVEDFALTATDHPAFQDFLAVNGVRPGFVGAVPASDGRQAILAFFEGAATALDTSMLPEGWTVDVADGLTWERAIRDITGEPRLQPTRSGPPLPSDYVGIGPGTLIFMARPDGNFLCTANFIWKDPAGNLYLGAAGHCFLPEGTVATHGPGADYNPALTRVDACWSGCVNGGLGSGLTGQEVRLGAVVYARQTGSGGDLGNDFGIVRIPNNLRSIVRTEMPVWNGPHGVAIPAAGDITVHYGNAAGFGETFPTKARAGLAMGITNPNSNTYWRAYIPSFQGDSGSAILIGEQTTQENVLEGVDAIGLLTHIAPGNIGPIVGTTVARAKTMTLADIGLTIDVVFAGEDVTTATVPMAPTGLTPTAGDGQVSLTWTAPSDGGSAITGYTVKYGTTAGGPYASTQAASGTSATVTGLTNGQWYHFVVTATNAVGESAASSEVSSRPTLAVTVPDAPTGLTALAGDGQVNLYWTAPADNGGSPVTGYTVRYGTASGTYTATQSSATTSAVVGSLVNGNEYFFAVSAVNAQGSGPLSGEASATPEEQVVATYSVEVRGLQDGVPVFGWTPADVYDGSAWAYSAADVPAGTTTIEARLLADGVPVATDSITVEVVSTNDAPTVDAGADADVHEGAPATLAGSASDPDGDFLTYAWTQTSGPAVVLAGADTPTATFTAPAVDADTTLGFELAVDDGNGHVVSDGVTVTVVWSDAVSADTIDGEPVDEAVETPLSGVVTVAGSSDFAPASQASLAPVPKITDVQVDGVVASFSAVRSFDPDGRIVAYAWDVAGVTRSGPTATFAVPPGVHRAILTVTDDTGVVAQTSTSFMVLGASVPAETYYLHRSACADETDPIWMDRTAALAEEAGHGCGNIGTAPFDTTWTSTVTTTTAYAAGDTVQAHVKAFTFLPDEDVTVVGTLYDGEDQIGQGQATASSISLALVTTPCSEWVVSFALTQAVPAGATLAFQATSPFDTGFSLAMCYEGGADASRVVLSTEEAVEPPTVAITAPSDGSVVDGSETSSLVITGTTTGATVDVAVSDPTFTSGLLTTTAGSPWSATWDVSDVPDGVYHVYARAQTEGVYSDVTSVSVVVHSAGGPNAPGIQVQVVPAGETPSGAGWVPATTFDGTSGAWSYAWDTDLHPDGMVDFHVRLVDGSVENARDAFTASLDNVHAPELDAIGDRSGVEDGALTFVVSATDADEDILVYSVENAPEGATFNGATGEFSWTPTFDQAGAYPGVRFIATDASGLSDQEDVTLTVANTNRAPAVGALADRAVQEGVAVSFAVTASDPDGDAVSVGTSELPEGATFLDGMFQWTPAYDQAGVHAIDFTASDGDLSTTETMQIVVTNIPGGISVTAHQGPAVDTSPGVSVVLTFTVKNTGLGTDVYHFAVTKPAGWTTVVSQDTVTLASKATTLVSVTVTPTATPLVGSIKLVSTSDLGAAVTKSTNIRLPQVVDLAMDFGTYFLQTPVTGQATVTHLDGTPVVGAPVAFTESSSLDGTAIGLKRTTVVYTDATGAARFEIEADPAGPNLPGEHLVLATATQIASAYQQDSATYDVV